MKKILFTIAITASCFLSTYAQIEYGVRINAGSSSMGNAPAGTSALFGLNFGAGLFAKLELLDRFGIQPEFNYTIRTGGFRNSDDANIYTNLSFNYIDIPILLYFPFSKNLSVVVGPQISAVNGSSFTSYAPKVKEVTGSVPGASSGIGYVIGLMAKFNKIDLSLRYNVTGGTEYAGSSSNIQLSLGYAINW